MVTKRLTKDSNNLNGATNRKTAQANPTFKKGNGNAIVIPKALLQFQNTNANGLNHSGAISTV